MKARILLVAAVVLVSGLALVPTTSAQAPSGNYYTVKLEWAHGEMTVPDTGRADMPLTATLEASGFVCTQECTVTAELKLDSFTKWAGASLEPFSVHFKIPGTQPGANPMTYPATEEVKLNLAWDLESAPRAGAQQIYVVKTGNMKVDGGPALPNPQAREGKSLPMTATLPDRPVEQLNATSVDCASDPFNPACANAATTAAAESPGIEPALLLASVVGVAFVFRRRRA
jgi:MYXO-CTERM domain-containing protein